MQNTVSYHTSAGCIYDLSQPQTGAFNSAQGTDCNALQHNDEACGNVDPSTTSFGSGASNVGGGVYALEWTSSHIKVRLNGKYTHLNDPTTHLTQAFY